MSTLEFVALREDLLAPLGYAASHAEPKGAMPVLRCVVLTATADGVLSFAATDFVRAYQGRARVEVKRAGSIAVDAAELVAQVNAFPAKAEVTFTLDEKLALRLTAKRIRATLAGVPADDMPTMPLATGTPVELDAADLAGRIAATRAAMSADTKRPHLHAVLLAGTIAAATDGHRLHKATGAADLPKVLIPAEAVESWRVALAAVPAGGRVTLRAESTSAPVSLETPAGIFTTKSIDAAFPSYEQVIPASQPWQLELDAAELRAATRAMPVSNLSHLITLRVETDMAGSALVIEGEGDGKAKRAEVACKVTGEGVPSKWGMKLACLLDATGAEGAVILGGHGELDPLTVHRVADPGFIAVVMPARV